MYGETENKKLATLKIRIWLKYIYQHTVNTREKVKINSYILYIIGREKRSSFVPINPDTVR